MEHVSDTQACFLTEALDFAHHLRKGSTRNHAVLNDVVGRDSPHGGERGFAAFPDESTFCIGLSQSNFRRAIRTANLVDVGHQRFDFGDGAIEFD